MANTDINFNVDPYYDDFDTGKNFHRILFRPGLAVQARELTQLQTILQNQIERIGDHLFKDGSVVNGGQIHLDYEIKYVKLANNEIASNYNGKVLQGNTSIARAKVVKTIERQGANTPTLFVKYLDGNRANAEGFVVASVNSTAYSLELNSTISQTNDHYNGKVIKLVGGPGKGQQRKIVDYIANSTVRTVVLNEALDTNPTTDSRFTIFDTTEQFVLGDRLFEVGNPGVVANVALTVPSGTVTGNASAVGVDEGVYYTRGTFVRSAPQFLILDPYSTKPTNVVGLSITESIVRSAADTTLLDPAQGSFNYTAPGADRWKIALTLDKKPVRSNANVASNNFIELLRVENGALTKVIEFPRYNKIGEELARRTFDESGNYTVRPFKLNFREFAAEAKGVIASASGTTIRLDDENVGTLRGRLSANNDYYNGQKIVIQDPKSVARGQEKTINDYDGASTTLTLDSAFSATPGANDSFTIFNPVNYVASLGQGKAYVEGYEFGTLGVSHLTMNRARDFLQVDNADIYNQMGNFIRIDDIGPVDNSISGISQFDPTAFSTVHLHYVPRDTISTTNTDHYQNTVIGTARVRQLSDSGSDSTDNPGRIYNLHLFDIRISNTVTGTVAQANSTLNQVHLANNGSSPSVDDIYNGATITVTNPGETTGTDAIVSDYDGGRKLVTLASNLQAQTQPGSTYTISFGTKNIRSVSIPDSSSAVTKLIVSANVALNGHVDSSYAANTKIRDTGQNKLVLPMPHNVIKTVRNSGGSVEAEYRFQRTFTGVSFSAGVGTISTDDGTERFVGTGTTLGDTLKRNHFIVRVTDEGTSSFTAGDIIDMTAASRTITVPTPSVGAVGTASLDTQDAGNFTGTVIASIDDNLAAEKTKTLVSANVTSALGTVVSGQIAVASPNRVAESVDTLRVSDVNKLRKVVDSLDPNLAVSTAMMTNSQHFITSKYVLDTGQRDNFYDHGSIRLKSGVKPPVGQILASFDYFTHSGGKGYFTVDSYTNIDYEDIPTYTSPISGTVYELRDSIDFRPKRQNSSLSNTEFVIEGGQIPLSGTALQVDYQFYLARIDKIAINSKDLNFIVIEGESSELPITPPDRNGAMTIYTLELPAYTFSTDDITVRPNNIKRYTMSDIGDLDKRLTRVEYYTALNALEKTAESATILDASGLDRFKNGIVVDNFTGHSVTDVKNEDFKISVDPKRQELRPFFIGDRTRKCIYYPLDTSSANRPVLNDNLIMLPFTEEEYLAQPLASRSIQLNPFNQVAWVGILKLDPDRDDFVNTNRLPDVNVNVAGDHDAWAAITGPASKAFGTEWGSWETYWTGVKRTDAGTRSASSRSGNYVTTKKFDRTKVTTTNKQNKFGVNTSVVADLQTDSLGDRVVDISIVPYIRTQDINFTVKGLKPNTRFYPYFDSIPVETTTKPTNGVFGDPLISDDKGELTGIFNIPDPNQGRGMPEESILKEAGTGFRVGERVFMVIDDPYGREDVASSYAEQTFVATGLKQVKETTYLTTRAPVIRRKTLQQTRTVVSKVIEEKLISTSRVYSPPPPPPYNGGDGRDGGGCGGRHHGGSDPCSGGDGCFLAGTMVTMADGSQKAIETIQLGEEVAIGGKIFAKGEFLVNDLYDYKGVKVSGSHPVLEDGIWKRVEKSTHGTPINNETVVVYNFGTMNRRLLIDGITFTDYFEADEIQAIEVMGDEYFDKWRDYGAEKKNALETRLNNEC